MGDSSENGGGPPMPSVDNQDSHPVPESFIVLPPEILGLVCGFLPKQALKKVRQVSKSCERAAVPYLFEEIFISQDPNDFRIAKLVILQFKHYVRTLVFSSVYYMEIDQESFDEQLDVDERHTSHSEHAFALYRIARKNQQASLTNGSSSAYLAFALASLPNIRKIVLTDMFSSRSMSHQSLQAYQPRVSKICPLEEDCDFTDHLPYGVLHSGFSRKGSTNPWRLVLFALSVTSTNLKELTMEPRDMELGTNTAAFSMPLGNLSQLKTCFRALTKIRFSLRMDTERFSTDLNTRRIHRNVAKLICSAVNLESLSLDLIDEHLTPDSKHSTLREILGRCKLPRLKSLNLAFIDSTEVELLRLLKHSRSLEHLTIECHNLTGGLWTRVADWIRASLPLLKHAELNQLYGGFDKPWDNTEYIDFYGYVGNFLLAQGENPFTTKALEKYHADREKTRQIDISSGGLGFIEAYFKYH